MLLQETWALTQINVEGFNSYCSPALKTNNRGRPQAGLASLVVSHLTSEAVNLLSDFPRSIQAIKLTFAKTTLIILNIYIPPFPNSASLHHYWSHLTSLMEDLERKFPSSEIILAGDFNARVGNDALLFHKALDIDHDTFLPPPYSQSRHSKDKLLNRAGICLTKFCFQFNRIWLNGSMNFANSGDFTFLSPRGCSVIDYIVISSSFLPYIFDFAVGDHTDSDHVPLTLIIKLHYQPSSLLDKQSPAESTEALCKIHWNEASIKIFSNLIKSHTMLELRLHCTSSDNPPEFIKRYEAILSHIVDSLIQSPRPQRNLRTPYSFPWADKGCRELKRLIRDTYRQFRDSNDRSLLLRYFDLKKQLQQLIQKKKEDLSFSQWEQLYQATIYNKSKLFWSIISGSSHKADPEASTVPSLEWLRHFSALFYERQTDVPNFLDPPLTALPNWPLTTPDEVRELIFQLKNGKAPGPDVISAEMLKHDSDFWAPLLASTFSMADQTGLMPEAWTNAIIAPIFKKGDRSLPSNYRPISLLSIIGKLYAKHLMAKLASWMAQSKIPGPEQIGFTKGKSTTDHCLVLYHLASKYSQKPNCKLYTAFLDLKGAFDSIDRDLLWSKLYNLNIDQRLLFLIKRLHTSTTCQVKCSPAGKLTLKIPVNKGVKQGCILAPALFNLFLNDMAPFLAEIDAHSPKIGSLQVPLLLYADDAVLISRTRVGLKRLLTRCLEYLNQNKLLLNCEKSKILVFSKSWRPLKWVINGNTIEQVKHFKYLGINFQYNLFWTQHRNSVTNLATSSTLAVSRFFYNTGNQFIPAAIKVFNAKVQAQILYGCPIWISSFDHSIECIQSKFLRKILGLPNCVPYAALCLETGQTSIESRAWLITFKYWLRLHNDPDPNSLIFQLLQDSSSSNWLAIIEKKISALGLCLDSFYMLSASETFQIIKQRVLDIEQQNLYNAANKTCSPVKLSLPCKFGHIASYLSALSNPQHRRAFSLARFNVMPSAVLTGRFLRTPHADRLCSCKQNCIDSISHILLGCPKYTAPRIQLLEPILKNKSGLSEADKVYFMLSDSLQDVSASVASFLHYVTILCNKDQQTVLLF